MLTTDLLSKDLITDYQNGIIDRLYDFDSTLVRLGMGGGKTVCTATAISELIANKVGKRYLVIAPLRVAQLDWKQDCARWEHLMDMPVHICCGPKKKRMQAWEDFMQHGGICTINVENAPWLFETFDVPKCVDGLVLDELTKWKNPTGKRLKAIMKAGLQDIPWRVGLTGSIRPSDVQDLFSMLRMVTNAQPLGKNITAFRKKFCIKDDYIQGKYYSAAGSDEKVAKLITPWVHDVPEGEYAAQLPPLHIVRVSVQMPMLAVEAYSKMLNEFMFEDIEAQTSAVKVSKLQQITGGFIYDEDKETHWLHDAKLDALDEIISEHNAPVLVAYKYRAELTKICERFDCPYIGAGVSQSTADGLITQWNLGKIPILAVHPASVGHGLNMQDGAWKIIWYSGTYSHEEHEQLIARLRRRGQSNDCVVSMHLIAGEVDEVVLRTALGKGALQENFVNYIRENIND